MKTVETTSPPAGQLFPNGLPHEFLNTLDRLYTDEEISRMGHEGIRDLYPGWVEAQNKNGPVSEAQS